MRLVISNRLAAIVDLWAEVCPQGLTFRPIRTISFFFEEKEKHYLPTGNDTHIGIGAMLYLGNLNLKNSNEFFDKYFGIADHDFANRLSIRMLVQARSFLKGLKLKWSLIHHAVGCHSKTVDK